MDRILDARQILRVADAAELRSKIDGILAGAGLTRHREVAVVAAYVNHGRWVADCPQCEGGIACWDQLAAGTCPDCGGEYEVAWPDLALRAEAEAVLAARSKPKHRNWRPGAETVDQLRAETTLLEGVL